MTGVLYVVATPIGNLDDISPRAAEALRSADVVACEDTRVTRKILTRVGSSARVVSVREANEDRMAPRIVEELRAGRTVVLATDAGTPGVADPGARVVAAAHAAGVKVVPVAGPSAVAAALSASGFRADRFVFEGYLPGRPGRRRRRLAALAGEDRPAVLFVPPHDLRRVLAEAVEVIGPDRPACLCRELTKVHEEVVRSTLGALAADADRHARGEVVLVIGPAST
jgi:16S rRNA (cytidine1402-2'-O)-methyltransferase